MTTNPLVLLVLASLPLLGGCTGGPNGDDSDTNPDDSGSGWAATIRITLPSDTPDGAEVWVDGDAVPSCDIASKECTWTATEAGNYEVEVQCDGLYFATQFAEVEDDGQSVDLAWQKGGCSDPEWSVGDGQCADTEGNSLWVSGQYGCDLTGFWKGVEDEFHDVRGDLEMVSSDVDGDSAYEAIVFGDDMNQFDEGVNVSGTTYYFVNSGDTLTSATMVDPNGDSYSAGTCSSTVIYVYTQNSSGISAEYHLELYEE